MYGKRFASVSAWIAAARAPSTSPTSLLIGTIATRWSLAAGFAAVILVLAAIVAALPALRARARLSTVPA